MTTGGSNLEFTMAVEGSSGEARYVNNYFCGPIVVLGVLKLAVSGGLPTPTMSPAMAWFERLTIADDWTVV